MRNSILEVTELKVSRGGARVLDIPELTVSPGEFLSIIGPNGTGKSTLLLSLAGLIKREHGDIHFHGAKIENGELLLAYRRHLAMVFQEPLLFDATVYENVASGLKIRGLKQSKIKPLVKENLSLFGISHLASRSARKISGGEAQRTSLARAFATQPEMIFLDEPFASLDPPTKESIIDDLGHVMKLKATTAIMATHDRMDALRLSNRIAVMDGGMIVQVGPPFDMMHHPVNETVAAFVGIETILDGKVKGIVGGVLEVNINGFDVYCTGEYAQGEKVKCFIRPEHVTIFPETYHPGSSARNVFTGTVTKVQPIGLLYRVTIDCGFLLSSHVTLQSVEDLHLDSGRKVKAEFKATSVHVIKSTDDLTSRRKSF